MCEILILGFFMKEIDGAQPSFSCSGYVVNHIVAFTVYFILQQELHFNKVFQQISIYFLLISCIIQ